MKNNSALWTIITFAVLSTPLRAMETTPAIIATELLRNLGLLKYAQPSGTNHYKRCVSLLSPTIPHAIIFEPTVCPLDVFPTPKITAGQKRKEQAEDMQTSLIQGTALNDLAELDDDLSLAELVQMSPIKKPRITNTGKKARTPKYCAKATKSKRRQPIKGSSTHKTLWDKILYTAPQEYRSVLQTIQSKMYDAVSHSDVYAKIQELIEADPLQVYEFALKTLTQINDEYISEDDFFEPLKLTCTKTLHKLIENKTESISAALAREYALNLLDETSIARLPRLQIKPQSLSEPYSTPEIESGYAKIITLTTKQQWEDAQKADLEESKKETSSQLTYDERGPELKLEYAYAKQPEAKLQRKYTRAINLLSEDQEEQAIKILREIAQYQYKPAIEQLKKIYQSKYARAATQVIKKPTKRNVKKLTEYREDEIEGGIKPKEIAENIIDELTKIAPELDALQPPSKPATPQTISSADKIFRQAKNARGTHGLTDKVMALYKKAADLGSHDALYTLGAILAAGEEGIEQKPTEAILLLEAYSQITDDPDGWFALAQTYDEQAQHEQALAALKKAAEQKHIEAINMLGFYHEEIEKFKNPQKAFECYKKAAKAGSLNGLINLAECYRIGFGTTTNPEQALALYEEILEIEKQDRHRILYYKCMIEVAKEKCSTLMLYRAFYQLGKIYEENENPDLYMALDYFKAATEIENENATINGNAHKRYSELRQKIREIEYPPVILDRSSDALF